MNLNKLMCKIIKKKHTHQVWTKLIFDTTNANSREPSEKNRKEETEIIE